MQHKWRKLVKSERAWSLEASAEGLHFTQDGEEHWVLPGDYVLDFHDERVICRGIDMENELTKRGFDVGTQDSLNIMRWLHKKREIVEVANHITDGKEHPDLWIERQQWEASTRLNEPETLIVHRQHFIDGYLADGYRWEDAAS